MVKPRPYLIQCENCGYKKLVRPESDVFPSKDMLLTSCPKCGGEMKIVTIESAVDKLLALFRK